MTKRMLIDATHAEETRVVVLDGNRLEDFDVETSTKRQLKGNIYLAKVVRVEPSLQAAFVEYGGNRHGFLAFSEIHPDYYQIPVADRQRLLDLQAEEARREDEEAELELALSQGSDSSDIRPGPDQDDGLDRHDGLDADEAASADPGVAPEPWSLAATPLLIAPEKAIGIEEAAVVADADAAPEPIAEAAAQTAPEGWALPSLPRLTARPAEPVSAVSIVAPAVETRE